MPLAVHQIAPKLFILCLRVVQKKSSRKGKHQFSNLCFRFLKELNCITFKSEQDKLKLMESFSMYLVKTLTIFYKNNGFYLRVVYQ